MYGEANLTAVKKVKCQFMIIVWTNLVEFESSMLHTKIQSQSFLNSGEQGVKCFESYMGMAAILFNVAKPFEQIDNTPSKERSMRKLLKIGRTVFEKKTF